jgi:hypothetical protein
VVIGTCHGARVCAPVVPGCSGVSRISKHVTRLNRRIQAHPALVHHERRLHKLMLAEEVRQYEREMERALSRPVSVSSQMDETMSLEGGSAESAAADVIDDPHQVRLLLLSRPCDLGHVRMCTGDCRLYWPLSTMQWCWQWKDGGQIRGTIGTIAAPQLLLPTTSCCLNTHQCLPRRASRECRATKASFLRSSLVHQLVLRLVPACRSHRSTSACNPAYAMQPDIKVTYAPARKYWFVRLICHDRNKLLFDLVCTFVDLDYDVFHATLDVEDVGGYQKSTMEFYVRPRRGGPDYDAVKGKRLAEMLRASILRRMPKGLKLHVQTHEVRASMLTWCDFPWYAVQVQYSSFVAPVFQTWHPTQG